MVYFSIRGVFQGDTLSPLLFLIAFNLILQSLCSYPAKGFSLLIEKEAILSPPSFPKKGSYVYALWNEHPSDEKPGWYLAKVASVTNEGDAILQCRVGGKLPSQRYGPQQKVVPSTLHNLPNPTDDST